MLEYGGELIVSATHMLISDSYKYLQYLGLIKGP